MIKIKANGCTALSVLFFIAVLYCIFNIGLNLGEHRKIKSECGKVRDCVVKNLVIEGSSLQPINKIK